MNDYSELAYSMSGVPRRNPFDRRRQFAQTLMQGGMDSSPVEHPLQGASRLAQALVGGWMAGGIDREERAATQKQNEQFIAAINEPDPQKRIGLLAAVDPRIGAQASASLAVEQAKLGQQQEGLRQVAGTYTGGIGPQMAQGGVGDRIGSFESGNRYDAVGPETGKGRALGKYQVMPFNVGPWTKEILGREMTPEEFLKDPQAQETVARTKMAQYRQQYGNDQDVASMWFTGMPLNKAVAGGNRPDVNGVTPTQYVQRTAGPPVAQGNNPQAAHGMPPAPSPQGINAPAVVAPPAIPQRPTIEDLPQEVKAQFVQRLQRGGYGNNPAQAETAMRADMQAYIDRSFEADKMRFQQQSQLAAEDRKDQQAEARRQREVAGPTPKDMQDLRVARSDAVGIVAALNDFKKTFENAGTIEAAQSALGFNTPLNTAWNSAALLAKGESLFNLGVLNGPDLEILRRALPDPSTFRGASTSTETMRKSVEKIIDLVQTRIAAKERQLGVPLTDMRGETSTTQGAQPGASPPAADGGIPTVNSPEEAARLPKGTQFRTPDGRIKVVP